MEVPILSEDITVNISGIEAKILICIEYLENNTKLKIMNKNIALLTGISEGTLSTKTQVLAAKEYIVREGKRPTLNYMTDEGEKQLALWKKTKDGQRTHDDILEDIKTRIQILK